MPNTSNMCNTANTYNTCNQKAPAKASAKSSNIISSSFESEQSPF